MKYISITLLSLLIAISADAGQWKNLFDGKTLKGWTRLAFQPFDVSTSFRTWGYQPHRHRQWNRSH